MVEPAGPVITTVDPFTIDPAAGDIVGADGAIMKVAVVMALATSPAGALTARTVVGTLMVSEAGTVVFIVVQPGCPAAAVQYPVTPVRLTICWAVNDPPTRTGAVAWMLYVALTTALGVSG
jgi:hypothetical protein